MNTIVNGILCWDYIVVKHSQKEMGIKPKQTNMVKKSHFFAAGRHPGQAWTLSTYKEAVWPKARQT